MPSTVLITILDVRAFQTSSPAQSATASCDPGDSVSANNNTDASPCQANYNNANDFASTSLWIVALGVVGGLIILTFFTFWLKRRAWYQARHRMREALWDLVNGVRDGTVDEAALRRLVDTHLGLGIQPKLYEARLSFQDSPFYEDKKSVDTDKKGAINEISMDAKKLDKNGPSSTAKDTIQWKWIDLRPLSVSQPCPLTDDPKQAYPKFKGKEKGPRLLQLPRYSSSQPSKGHHAKLSTGNSAITTASEQHTFIKSGTMGIERGITPVVMIAMPHPDRSTYLPPTRPVNGNNAANLNLMDVPIKLGVISTTVIEDLSDPIAPMLPIKRQQKKSDVLAEALSSNRVGGMAARAEDMSLRADLHEMRRREEEERRAEVERSVGR